MLVDVATDTSRPAAAAASTTSLADLLALPALAGARVVPRDADTSVAVTAIAPVDPGTPPEPGTLLVAVGFASDELTGAAAALSRTAPADVPEVPMIVLPEEASWTAVIAAVSEAVAGGVRGASDLARGRLREALLRGEGYGAIARVGADLLGAPVSVVDPYLDAVGVADVADAQTARLEEIVEAARAADTASIVAEFLAASLPKTQRRAVPGSEGDVGAVVVWRSTKLSAADEAVLAEVVDACALEHARDEARIETEARLRGELVEELIAGEVVSRESIVRRARLLGADLSNGAVAMIGTLQDPELPDRSPVDGLVGRRFLSHVRAALDLHWPRALVDWNEGRLLVLLPTGAEGGDDAGIDERAKALARRLLAATKDTVPGLAVTLALSRHTPEPENLGAALDEAELALSIGERLGRHGDVVTFEETGTYKLLFQIFADRPQELATFYEQTLEALVKYDEQYQTELVGTLATYLELDGNLAATAGTLYTHRHTVRYRLDRIAELSGLDVGKSDDREKLSLGLKAMRLLGKPVRTGPAEKLPSRGRG